MSARCDRNNLLWRDVHHLDFVAGHERNLGGRTEEDVLLKLQSQTFERGRLWRATHEHLVGGKRTVFVDRGVGLGNNVFLFLVSGEIADVVGDYTAFRPRGTATR